MLGGEDGIKALVTAITSAVIAQIIAIFDLATDPNSPGNILDQSKKNIDIIESWARADALLKDNTSSLKTLAQEKNNAILQSALDSQSLFEKSRETKRRSIFRVLGYLRLYGLRSWFKKMVAFFFYVTLALLWQAIKMFIRNRYSVGHEIIFILAGAVVLLWIISWPSAALDTK